MVRCTTKQSKSMNPHSGISITFSTNTFKINWDIRSPSYVFSTLSHMLHHHICHVIISSMPSLNLLCHLFLCYYFFITELILLPYLLVIPLSYEYFLHQWQLYTQQSHVESRACEFDTHTCIFYFVQQGHNLRQSSSSM